MPYNPILTVFFLLGCQARGNSERNSAQHGKNQILRTPVHKDENHNEYQGDERDQASENFHSDLFVMDFFLTELSTKLK